MSVKYCLPVPVFQLWLKLTHPAARSICDSWATCFHFVLCLGPQLKFLVRAIHAWLLSYVRSANITGYSCYACVNMYRERVWIEPGRTARLSFVQSKWQRHCTTDSVCGTRLQYDRRQRRVGNCRRTINIVFAIDILNYKNGNCECNATSDVAPVVLG